MGDKNPKKKMKQPSKPGAKIEPMIAPAAPTSKKQPPRK